MAEPPNDAETEALEALDYSETWLESGILDARTLLEQYARMQAGGTRKTARYRNEALAAWRSSRP